MTDPKFRKIRDLTDAERDAARAYGAESGHYHLAVGADFSLITGRFADHQSFIQSGQFSALRLATNCYELAESAVLWSGHGNGSGIFGSLGQSDPASFQGMKFQYRGFTSTSSRRDRGEHFVETRAKHISDVPALLEFHVPAGFRLLPFRELGADMTHEAEYLLPPSIPFRITRSEFLKVGTVENVRHLRLEPTPCS